MDAKALVLLAAFRHTINEPNIEAAFERLQAITGDTIDYDAFRDVVSACLREGLIREPIRLPEGALQCHWHLELTPKGVDAVCALPRHSHRPSLRDGDADEQSQRPILSTTTERK
jgi:hypothetical protein